MRPAWPQISRVAASRYRSVVLERTQTRMLPLVARAADVAPVTPACCNVCRTCMTTNLVGAAMGAGVAIVVGARRLVSRLRLA
jgi:hypothetical protein